MKNVKTVDEFILKSKYGKEILILLRELISKTGLEETIKWGAPVYTLDGKNIVGISSFKAYSGLWFFQGALLKDKENVLVNAQEDKTKALRQWRFASIDEVDENLVLEYLNEAIQNQKKNKEIKPERNKALVIPEELEELFTENPLLKKRYNEFSPGKQREFAEYITDAKREDTRINRINKIIPLIRDGIGLNDKYRK